MWALLSGRLRTKLMLIVALPLARFLVHRLAVFAGRRGGRSARLLNRADAAVTTVSRRSKRAA
ncbi:MAG: hypothetical protein ACR2FU_13625 [Streptosporangiaceae bacterium]